MISPSNTGPGLTRGGPLAEGRGEPEVYYPTGRRNFFRVVAREDVQGTAHAMVAKRLGLKRVQALYPSDDDDWKIVDADPFRRAARRLGMSAGALAAFDPEAKSYDALADRIARSRAQAVLLTGFPPENGDRLLNALRARLGRRVKIMVTDMFAPLPDVLDRSGPAARGLYMSTTDGPPIARAADARRPALRPRLRRRGHAHRLRAAGRAGRGGRAPGDRALRRNPGLGARGAAGDQGEGRHPRRLPLRPRGHHAGPDHDPPRDRQDPAAGRSARAVQGGGARPRRDRAAQRWRASRPASP